VIKIKKWNCDDCKWNFLCTAEEQNAVEGKCDEFELDRIISDRYVDLLIERNRKEFTEQWIEIYDDYNGT